MLLLTLEKPRRRIVQPQNITRQNKQRSKEHELTISTYRNIRKILKRQRISTFFAAIWICFTRNTVRTPQETQLRSRIRHLMITLLHGTGEGLYACYPYGTYYYGVKAQNNPISRMLEGLSNDSLPSYECESNENLKYFYLVIYWTHKVHNDIIFLSSLHCVPYKCSSASEVHGYL
jgi:hypothetical protein